MGRGSAAVGLVCAALIGAPCATASATTTWSVPARPAGCALALSPAAAPLIVFPSSSPQVRSGPGALLWTAPRRCRMGGDGEAVGGAGAAGDGAPAGASLAGGGASSGSGAVVGAAFGSSLGEDDRPGRSRPLTAGADDLVGIAAATGTARGQVIVAGPGAGPGGAGALVEGGIAGPLRPAGSLDGPSAPLAAFSAFLGDAVVVSPVRRRNRWDLAVRVQRHYSDAAAAPLLLPAGPARPSAVAAAMDYRGDVLAVWAGGGGVFAREVVQAGAVGPVRRLGSSPRDSARGPARDSAGGPTYDPARGSSRDSAGGPARGPELQAQISDDGRAIVAWRSQTALPGGGVGTSIELSISDTATGVGRLWTVERFDDPPGWAPPAGSLRLVRLSSEAVMMAWTGVQAGRYAVRASPVSLRRGAWAPVTISPPGADAVLADLAPGPRAEALALWTSAPRLPSGAPDTARRAILAARGHYAGPGRVAFGPPEVIAPPGPNGAPAAAIDPRGGQAIAAWVTLAERAGAASGPQIARVSYSLRGAGQTASARPPAGGRSTASAAPLAIVLSAGAALLALGGVAWLAVGRRSAGRVRPGRARPNRG